MKFGGKTHNKKKKIFLSRFGTNKAWLTLKKNKKQPLHDATQLFKTETIITSFLSYQLEIQLHKVFIDNL